MVTFTVAQRVISSGLAATTRGFGIAATSAESVSSATRRLPGLIRYQRR